MAILGHFWPFYHIWAEKNSLEIDNIYASFILEGLTTYWIIRTCQNIGNCEGDSGIFFLEEIPLNFLYVSKIIEERQLESCLFYVQASEMANILISHKVLNKYVKFLAVRSQKPLVIFYRWLFLSQKGVFLMRKHTQKIDKKHILDQILTQKDF